MGRTEMGLEFPKRRKAWEDCSALRKPTGKDPEATGQAKEARGGGVQPTYWPAGTPCGAVGRLWG